VDEQRLILVVEDDETTRAFLAENLVADGFRVAGAASAPEALRAIGARQPALVLSTFASTAAAGSTFSTACVRPTAWPRGSTPTSP
jgi:CheY-like chemotaxis protein